MSPSILSYLAGMLVLFVGQRILNGIDPWQGVVSGLAGVLLAGALGLRVRALRATRDPGSQLGHRMALLFAGVGLLSLVLYAGTTEWWVALLSLDDSAQERWLGVGRSLWPMVWLLGVVPLMVIDYGLRSSPTVIPAQRIRETLVHSVVAVLGLCVVFPLNYVATKRNERWDLAYFKTPTPGTATHALVEALEQPVTARVFMPPASEVSEELRRYFAELEGPSFQVEFIDQAANPVLSKALSVRDNGVVTFTHGDISALLNAPSDDPHSPSSDDEDGIARPVTRRLRVGEDLDAAKRTLKKLDAEVSKILIELGQGERVAYFTSGHGELNWSTDKEVLDASIRGLRGRMLDLGFSIKSLGISEGLAEAVPDDASVVLILGPRKPFFQPEVDALSAYLDRGGSILLAQEPALVLDTNIDPTVSDPLNGLMTKLGVKMGPGVLAAERNIVPLARNRLDAFNIVTNGFSSHATTQTISDRAQQLVIFTPAAGYLEEVADQPNHLNFVIRSLAYVWADLDANTRFDADAGETKEARNLMAVVEGGTTNESWRAVVTSDASMFADLGVGNLGNQRLVDDVLNWLIGAEALAGVTQSEEDVKIEHTKGDQQWWFYLTVLVIPLGVLVLGALRIRWRGRGGAA